MRNLSFHKALRAAILWLVLGCMGYGSGAQIITTYAGNGLGGYSGDGGQATAGQLFAPSNVVVDISGNIYIADEENYRIRKVTTSGIISTIAGNGTYGFSGDGGPATAAEIRESFGITVDIGGNVYFSDDGNYRIRKISPTGIISTVAGSGSEGFSGDGGPATLAELWQPQGLAIDSIGNLYIADADNARIRKVTPSGIISTIAGNGSYISSGDGGPATAAGIYYPVGLAFDRNGNLYFSEYGDYTIRKIAPSGIINTIAGNGDHGFSGDGGPATAAEFYFSNWGGVAVDTIGNVYIADDENQRIRMINPSGIVNTIAGSGTSAGYGGDGGPATTAQLNYPTGVAVNRIGNVFISDLNNNRIRVIKSCTNSNVGPILGATLICIGDSLTLSDTAIGGTWSSNDTGQATVGTSSGLVKGVAAGVTGITYSLNDGCQASTAVTVDPTPGAGVITGIFTLCPGISTVLSDGVAGGTWSSHGHATITSGGMVTGLSIGMDTVFYTVTNACGNAVATHTVEITSLPNAGTITGPSTVCTGSVITLSDASAGGVWSSINPRVAVNASTGAIFGIAPGPAVVYYTVSNTCGTAIDSATINVDAEPYAGAITGFTALCVGDSALLTDTVHGGAWGSGDPFVATVSGTGELHGISFGVAFISYTVSNACGSAVALAIADVNLSTPIDGITGASSVCTSLSTTLSDGTPGGSWSSGDTDIATINSSGIVTGVSGGVAAISYSVNAGCGLSVATALINVVSSPSAGTLSGPATLCAGATNIFTSTVSGGAWSGSNSHTTIAPLGIITGISAGTDTLTYSVTNSCGTAVATRTINIYPAPATGVITGLSSNCAGTTINLTDTATGGVWSSSNTLVAIVGGTGIVDGVAAGSAVISYAVTSGCGIAAATKTITINATNAGFISGVTTLCAGGVSTLSDAAGGGIWSSSAPTVASIGSTGVVNAIAPGAALIFYTVTGPCGTATASTIFTVGDLPVVAPVTGATPICVIGSVTLADGTLGGVWSSANTAVATIGSTGVVHGISAGTVTISYMVTAGCGSGGATAVIQVEAIPVAGSITGSNSLCAANTTTLTESITGGAWSSSNTAIATIGTSGLLSGIAPGSAIITYTVTDVCGSALATHTVTIKPQPDAGSISGATVFCSGGSNPLSASASGGAWSSGNMAVATVGSAGLVSGVAAGIATISYSVTNSCGTAYTATTITVNPLPYAGVISGDTEICAAYSTSLSDPALSGAWSSSNTAIASVGSAGLVGGIAPGTVIITYTVTDVCGSALATHTVTIKPQPDAGSISGATVFCSGGSDPLSASASGGAWSSGNMAVATVGSAGLVSGVAAGIATISYSVTNSCGTAYTATTITVNPLPYAGTISGDSAICVGYSTRLSDTALTGVWNSGNAAVAAVNDTGVVTGNSGGVAVIYYTVTNSCGTAETHINITVNAPYAGIITGITTLCAGGVSPLNDSAGGSGGLWSSSAPSVATIGSATGIVNTLAPGTTIIFYTDSGLCGVDTTTTVFTVGAAPSVPPISGALAVCNGHSVTLTDAVTGGVWSSSNTSVATIGSTGILSGVSAGTSTISYLVTAGCGGTAASATIQVDTAMPAGIISGNATLCKGTTDTLSENVTGGIWGSSNTTIATITDAGVMTAADTGAANISYIVTNSCGSATASFTATIVTLPYGGIITGNTDLCVGNTAILSDAAGGGIGAWSSSVPGIASIGSTGIITGISQGVAAVSYALTNSCGTGFATTPVTVYPLPGAGTISGPDIVCKSAQFTLTESNPGGTWNSGNPGTATIDSASGMVNALTTGTAIITFTTSPNAGNCTNTTTFVIDVLLSHPFGIAGTISPVNCYGNNNGSIQVTPGIDPYQYGWSNGDSSATINNLSPGIYAVFVKDLVTQCTTTDSFTVKSPDSLFVISTITNDSCKAGDGSISVSVSGGVSPYTYLWSNNGTGNEITGLSAGQYTLLVSDNNKCEKNSVYEVEEINCNSNEVVVHDVITPNGDGINDFWVIDNLQKYPNNTVQIFDKEGDMVYQKSNYNNDWNGQASNGDLLPDGTYFYLVKLNAPNASGGDNVFTGAILIKR